MVDSTNTNARRLVWVVAMLVAAGAAIVSWFAVNSNRSHGGDSAATVESAPVAIEDANSAHDGGDLRSAVPSDEEPIFTARDGETIHGLVLDLDGRPVAAVGIAQRVMSKSKLVARSGGDGTFTAVLEKLDGSLVAARGAWATVAPCKLMPGRETKQHVLVVAPSIDIGGRVVDERGHSVCAAAVGVRMLPDAKAHLPRTLDVPSDILASTTCDASGSFAVLGVPSVPGSRLFASCEPLLPQPRELPATSDRSIVLLLRDPAKGVFVEGVVVHADGSPASGATVKIGRVATPTTATGKGPVDGRFRLLIDEHVRRSLDPRTPLFAQADGFQPALIADFGRAILDARGALLDQRIELPGPELRITGTIVDPDGRPIPNANAYVRVVDGTELFLPLRQDTFLEQWCGSGPDGGFRVCNLLPRSYVLECTLLQPKSRFRSEPILAGTSDVVLRVPSAGVVPRVAGRVVDRSGAPVAGARVSVEFEYRGFEFAPCWPAEELAERKGAVVCDAGGAFELRDVWTPNAHLVVDGASIAPQAIALDGHDFSGDLQVIAQRLCSLRLEGFDRDLASAKFDLRDASGHLAPSSTLWWSEQGGLDAAQFEAGRTADQFFGEGHYVLTLTRGQREILHRDVELVPGQPLVVVP
jgi:hypothetical protein